MTKYYNNILKCDEPIRSKIQVYTDSLSMINKLEAYDEYPTAPLATVLNSEWDVLSALHRALQWFRTKPKINWVKSHQDDMVFVGDSIITSPVRFSQQSLCVTNVVTSVHVVSSQ